jgi:Coenzyme PQQ synthesis protein D (PqqD)
MHPSAEGDPNDMQHDRFKVNSAKVVHETIEGEAILIHLDNGFYYSLDGAGAEIWGLLAASFSAEEAAAALDGRYDADAGTLAAEVSRLADELVAEDLLESGGEAPAGSPNGAAPEAPHAFAAPELKRYEDMQDFLLVDPIHETSEAGWPDTQPNG